MTSPPPVLLLPGWGNSGAAHWQTLWQAEYGDVRVEQHDWDMPKRGDWLVQLEEYVLRSTSASPIKPLLAAHSLGCQLIANWSATSKSTHLIQGALLVAPPDLEMPELPQALVPWRPITLAPLKFPATVVASSDDPYCPQARAALFAQNWGASFVSIGARGHINSDSGLGAWAEGRSLLQQLA